LFFVILAQPQHGLGQTKMASVSVRDTISTEQGTVLIDVLHKSLQSLADKDREGRLIGGYVLLGLGIGSGLGGAATLAFGEGDDARIVGYSLLGGGAVLSGLSLIPFSIRSESEKLFAEFNKAPDNTPNQIHAKFYYWDRRFEELAQKRKKERIVFGISSIITGGVAAILVKGPAENKLYAFTPVLTGVTSLFVKSEEEIRYETYRRSKGDILQQKGMAEIHFGITPLPIGGIVSVVQVRF